MFLERNDRLDREQRLLIAIGLRETRRGLARVAAGGQAASLRSAAVSFTVSFTTTGLTELPRSTLLYTPT